MSGMVVIPSGMTMSMVCVVVVVSNHSSAGGGGR